MGSWNSKCDYLRLPICSLLFAPPNSEWELLVLPGMLIDFWLCVLCGGSGMRRLAQKGSNVQAINRNLCEIVFFFLGTDHRDLLTRVVHTYMRVQCADWIPDGIFGLGCDVAGRHRWHIPVGRMTSVNACFVYYFQPCPSTRCQRAAMNLYCNC